MRLLPKLCIALVTTVLFVLVAEGVHSLSTGRSLRSRLRGQSACCGLLPLREAGGLDGARTPGVEQHPQAHADHQQCGNDETLTENLLRLRKNSRLGHCGSGHCFLHISECPGWALTEDRSASTGP